MSDKLEFSTKDWRIKTQERTKGRMKIQIKLNKEEATALKSLQNSLRPESVTEADFLKTLFLMGVESLNQNLLNIAEQKAAEQGMTVEEMIQGNKVEIIENDDTGEAESSSD